jgi:hypothetical protein
MPARHWHHIVSLSLAIVGIAIIVMFVVSGIARVMWESRNDLVFDMYANMQNLAQHNSRPIGDGDILELFAMHGPVIDENRFVRCPDGHVLVWMSPSPHGDTVKISSGLASSELTEKMFFACCAHAHSDGSRFFIFSNSSPLEAYQADSSMSWLLQRPMSLLTGDEQAAEVQYREKNRIVHPDFDRRLEMHPH